MSEWKNIPQHFPIDGDEVYARRMDFWESFECTWEVATQEFVLPNGYRMPWWTIARWKVKT